MDSNLPPGKYYVMRPYHIETSSNLTSPTSQRNYCIFFLERAELSQIKFDVIISNHQQVMKFYSKRLKIAVEKIEA